MNEAGACIVQRDLTVLLEKEHPGFAAAREILSAFAELVKSPAVYHTYRITPLTLWNAAAGGLDAEAVIGRLRSVARWDLPEGAALDIRKWMSRYGALRLYPVMENPELIELENLSREDGLLDELIGRVALPGGKPAA
ncbi:helicase-associated domain-containing protein, partial [Paenibacillus macerans]